MADNLANELILAGASLGILRTTEECPYDHGDTLYYAVGYIDHEMMCAYHSPQDCIRHTLISMVDALRKEYPVTEILWVTYEGILVLRSPYTDAAEFRIAAKAHATYGNIGVKWLTPPQVAQTFAYHDFPLLSVIKKKETP
jgi:hypothetical protein